jgi:signal transduction histidine kinase
MEEEIHHLDRLAVLGRFTSAIAHEIRNPLTGIAAGIQYLDRSEKLSDEQKENISFILNEVDRLNRIITDLFKIAKPKNLLYQNIELSKVIDRSIKSVSEIISSKNIRFHKKIDDDIPLVDIDSDQITQVLINLIKNSTEAVGDGGVIEVKAKLYKGEDPDVIMEKDREMFTVEVTDDGPGIEEGDRGRVFEPFFSRKKGGTGLGLFVSHSIIQHHQGRIKILSDPGDGTVFIVYLPLRRPSKGGKVETGSASGR